MKKRYASFAKTWFGISMVLIGIVFFSIKLPAQTRFLKQWEHKFVGTGKVNYVNSLVTDNDHYLFLGYSDSSYAVASSYYGTISRKVWVLKTDAEGKELWRKSFPVTCAEWPNKLFLDRDGSIFISGSKDGAPGYNCQGSKSADALWLIKFTADGQQLWHNYFGQGLVRSFFSIGQIADYGFIIDGKLDDAVLAQQTKNTPDRKSFHLFHPAYLVIRIDKDGNQVWEKRFPFENHNDDLSFIKQTSDGGFIAGGKTSGLVRNGKREATQGGIDYWVTKLDASGNTIWEKYFGGSKDDLLATIEETADHGFLLAGTSQSGASGHKTSSNKGREDVWILKIDPSGNKIWDKAIGGPHREHVSWISQTKNNSYQLAYHTRITREGKPTKIRSGCSAGNVKRNYRYINKGHRIVKFNLRNGVRKPGAIKPGNNGADFYNLQWLSDGGYTLVDNKNRKKENQKLFKVTIKLVDAKGRTWRENFHLNEESRVDRLKLTPDGGFLLEGRSFPKDSFHSPDNASYWVAKYLPKNKIKKKT